MILVFLLLSFAQASLVNISPDSHVTWDIAEPTFQLYYNITALDYAIDVLLMDSSQYHLWITNNIKPSSCILCSNVMHCAKKSTPMTMNEKDGYFIISNLDVNNVNTILYTLDIQYEPREETSGGNTHHLFPFLALIIFLLV